MNDQQALQYEIERLRASVDELSALNEIATAIGSSVSLEDINNRIVEMVVKRTHATQGAIFLLAEGEDEKPMQTMVRVKDSSITEDPARFGMAITGRVLKTQAPLNISHANDPDRLLEHTPEFVKSVLSVPMKAKGKFVGVLSVFNKRAEDSFSITDQRFMSILAAQSVQIIERTRFEEVERNLTAIKKELSVASDIQAAFMPRKFPAITGYDMFAQNLPADEVGGDSFDLILANSNKIILTQGDVTGHGVPAALLMAVAQTVIRSKVDGYLEGRRSFAQFVTEVSDYVFHNSELNMFMTMFLAALDTKEHTLEFVRAGHPTPVLCDSSGEITPLDQGGLPLGIIEDAEYQSGKVSLSPGSMLTIYSDGVTELENSDGEQYGEPKLIEFVKDKSALLSSKLCAELFAELKTYSGDNPQDDDITILAVHRE